MAISPIQVSANGRYFVGPDGTPVFWLGDTQWELFRCYEPETALQILCDRHVKGFNAILVMLTGVDHRHLDTQGDPSFANVVGELPWIDDDPLQPNERYFAHVDRLIRLGEQTGQTLVVGVYHQWHRDIITLDKARAWARWVATRYRDVPNLIWSMYPRAEAAYVPICRELAAGLQAGDEGVHLISVHPDPAVASSSFLHDEAWLAFNMIQTCVAYDQIVPAVLADYARTPSKPVIMAEGGYEGVEFGRRQTALEIRQQAYWTQLAGGFHVYGHNDAWTAPEQWATWMEAPGSWSLCVFHAVITSLDRWWTLEPAPEIIAAGEGEGYSRNVAARAANGSWALIYLSTPSAVSVDLERAVTGPATATWIDPRQGKRTLAKSTITGVQAFTTPEGWEDALLLLAAA